MTISIFEMTADEVQEALNGNERLFAQLIQRNRKTLMAVLRRNGTSQNDIEDCAQHAFIKLWENSNQVREPRAVFSWLCTTALHRAQDIQRSTNRMDLV
jgi:DNA-directed RNA polymerase specialized sigma24 family protein